MKKRIMQPIRLKKATIANLDATAMERQRGGATCDRICYTNPLYTCPGSRTETTDCFNTFCSECYTIRGY